MIVSTKAIVLRVIKHGETSKIVELFTYDFGRVSVMAKGARTNKSKFAGILEPASIIEASFYMKPNRDMYLLNSAELVVNSQRWQADLARIGAALTICESLLDTQPTHFQNDVLFANASLSIQFISVNDTNPKAILLKYFIELCLECGFELNFDESIGDLKSYLLLNIGQTQSLKPIGEPFRVLSARANALGAEFESLDLIDVTTSNADGAVCMETLSAVIAYLERHIGKPLNFRSLSLL